MVPGLIGKYLSTFFIQKGYTVYILSRKKTAEISDPNLQYVQWTPDLQTFPLSSIDVVINLAGESINSRWTKKQKKVILNSRIKTTKGLIKQLQALPTKPHTFINASAIGYYGTSETESFTELHVTPGNDFLANTVYSWEQEASKARALGNTDNLRKIRSRIRSRRRSPSKNATSLSILYRRYSWIWKSMVIMDSYRRCRSHD